MRACCNIDNVKSFNNLYNVTNRKLGVGGTGEVAMAIDFWNRCQVACKIVNLIKPMGKNAETQQRPGTALKPEWRAKLWREVELLKHISHVGSLTSSLIIYANIGYSRILSR